MDYKITYGKLGDPDVMSLDPIDVLAPNSHEVQVAHKAIGVNYIDIYHRSGLYLSPEQFRPFGLGVEAAGVITSVGDDVTNFKEGDRIVYITETPGAYATTRNIPAQQAVPLPPNVSFEVAAASFLKAMTVQFLFEKVYPVNERTTMLFHAASGGVGVIASQWASRLGATIYGTVGSVEKSKVARSAGCTYVIDYSQSDFAKIIADETNGIGLDVVFDSVGKDTFAQSLNCLKPFGLMVSFGNSSGKVDHFDIGLLAQKGSLYLTRPSLFTAIKDPMFYNEGAIKIMELLRMGALSIDEPISFKLKDVVDAHRALAGRKTTGSLILIP